MSTTESIEERLRVTPVIPLVQADDPATAIKITGALVEGGLTVAEVVLRTKKALQCLEAVVNAFPDTIVGVGTILDTDQCESAVQAGAKFVVSPGFDHAVVELAQAHEVPVFPGIATASETQQARNLGLRTLKFFPAGQAGGTAMLRALSSVFRDVRFIPTGGISARNLAEYLAIPAVIACGGSWLTPKSAIDEGRLDVITKLAQEAIVIADAARG